MDKCRCIGLDTSGTRQWELARGWSCDRSDGSASNIRAVFKATEAPYAKDTAVDTVYIYIYMRIGLALSLGGRSGRPTTTCFTFIQL